MQLRQPVGPPPGEARSDTDILFDLAVRLGLGEHFWNGDVEAAYRHQLATSGLGLEALRDTLALIVNIAEPALRDGADGAALVGSLTVPDKGLRIVLRNAPA